MGVRWGMLLEAIILSACLEGSGCHESMEAYYLSSPELEHFAKNTERKMIMAVGEQNVKYVMPGLVLVFAKEGSISIDNHWSIKRSRDRDATLLVWTY